MVARRSYAQRTCALFLPSGSIGDEDWRHFPSGNSRVTRFDPNQGHGFARVDPPGTRGLTSPERQPASEPDRQDFTVQRLSLEFSTLAAQGAQRRARLSLSAKGVAPESKDAPDPETMASGAL